MDKAACELEDAIISLIRNHSSPTIGHGSIHGGQRGYIVYEPSIRFIAAGLRRLMQKDG
jgi:hypothetical protein